jgi:arylamine N-acetyltransferase
LYSQAELGQYFRRISLPAAAHLYDVSSLDAAEQLQHLGLLLRHQLTNIPFENLTLHYSTHRVININPKHLFAKIVLQPGRGGYCMENNTLFHTVLLTLGFDVYLAGARVFEGGGRLTGLSHCLNIVTIGGERYAVDTGFGPNEPIHPLRIVEDVVQPHIPPASTRLCLGSIEPALRKDQKLWIHEHRPSEDGAWTPQYCFSEMEFLPQDFAVMNYFPQTDRATIFTQKLLCVKFTWDEQSFVAPGEDNGSTASGGVGTQINGTLILMDDNFKWRKNGEKVFEKKLASEAERLSVLKEYFGIELAEADKEAILGTTLEIQSK